MRLPPQASACVHVASPGAEGEGTVLPRIVAPSQAKTEHNAFLQFCYTMGRLSNQCSLIIIHSKLFISFFSFWQGKQVKAGHFLVDCEKIDRSISLTCGSDVERKESKGNMLVAFCMTARQPGCCLLEQPIKKSDILAAKC